MKIPKNNLIISLILLPSLCNANESITNFSSVICQSISELSGTVMTARQHNMSAEKTKDWIEKGIQSQDNTANKINSSLQNTMKQIVDEAYYFPIQSDKKNKEVISKTYATFVLNRCQKNLEQLSVKLPK